MDRAAQPSRISSERISAESAVVRYVVECFRFIRPGEPVSQGMSGPADFGHGRTFPKIAAQQRADGEEARLREIAIVDQLTVCCRFDTKLQRIRYGETTAK